MHVQAGSCHLILAHTRNSLAEPTTEAATLLLQALSGAMRLGLKLEQRGDVRKLVDMLQKRLRQAGGDLQAAVGEIQGLRGSNQMLVGQVMQLQQQLGGSKTAREEELEQQLLQVGRALLLWRMHICICGAAQALVTVVQGDATAACLRGHITHTPVDPVAGRHHVHGHRVQC